MTQGIVVKAQRPELSEMGKNRSRNSSRGRGRRSCDLSSIACHDFCGCVGRGSLVLSLYEKVAYIMLGLWPPVCALCSWIVLRSWTWRRGRRLPYPFMVAILA